MNNNKSNLFDNCSCVSDDEALERGSVGVSGCDDLRVPRG